MPFITVKALEGRTAEQKRELVQRMSELVSEVFVVDKDRIHIFFEDLKKEDYGKNGDLLSFIDQQKK